MNLSAEKIMNRELERRVGRDEKKEEEVRQDSKPISSLASDEDWLDELVSHSNIMMSLRCCTILSFFILVLTFPRLFLFFL